MRWVLLIVGLSAGIGAALLLSAAPEITASQQAATGQTALSRVLVAAADLPAGQKLAEDDLVWADWPEEAVLDGFIEQGTAEAEDTEYEGKVIRSRLSKGMPLMTQNLLDGDTGYLSAILTPGMRAVALKISAEQTAGGFILPDDRVDVLLAKTCPDGVVCSVDTDVEAILQNVRVLAIDQAGSVAADGTAIVGETATLELSPEDAQILVAAQAIGTPTLVLRAAGDTERLATPTRKRAAQPAPQPQAAPEAAPAPLLPAPVDPQVVRVIRNGSVATYELN